MTRRRAIFLVLTIGMLLFIWGQSVLPGDMSSRESGWVREKLLQPILSALHMGEISEHLVRKLAHGTEYFVLSVCMSMLLMDTHLRWHVIPFCFLSAFLDESIQLLSGRGPMIADVWIDMLGAVTAFFVCLTVCLCLIHKRGNRSQYTS